MIQDEEEMPKQGLTPQTRTNVTVLSGWHLLLSHQVCGSPVSLVSWANLLQKVLPLDTGNG